MTIAVPDLLPSDPGRLVSAPLVELLEQGANPTNTMRALQPGSTGGHAEALLRSASSAGAG